MKSQAVACGEIKGEPLMKYFAKAKYEIKFAAGRILFKKALHTKCFFSATWSISRVLSCAVIYLDV